jgi:hypothetical protein
MSQQRYDQYEEILEPAAKEFYSSVLADAQEYFGVSPYYPIQIVHLAYSHRVVTTEEVQTSFQRCDLNSKELGEYTIYISSDEENEGAFYGQFAHEIAHLLNPRLYDAYVVGYFTLFAQKMCNKYGKQWDDAWLPYFTELMQSISANAFYAQTYFLVEEIDKIVNDEERSHFLKSAIPDSEESYSMHIDPNLWLAKMRPEIRPLVLGVIQKYQQGIYDCKECSAGANQSTFQIPEKDVEIDHSSSMTYEIIKSDEIDKFVRDGVALMKDFFGFKPLVNINSLTVLNGLKPVGRNRSAPESRTDLVDAENGKYQITMIRQPNEKSFFGQLAFHIAELAMVDLVDVFFQGYCSVFARKLCSRFGQNWDEIWNYYYKKILPDTKGDALFANSFFMMYEIDEIITEQERHNFLKCAFGEYPKLNVETWVATMKLETKEKVVDIFDKYADGLSKCDDCTQM